MDRLERTDKILRIIKITIKALIYTLVFAFIGALFFRIWANDYYPKSMKKLYFTESLIEYYEENKEDFVAYKQDVRIKYDSKEEGNFFASNAIVVPDANALQIALRANDSTFEKFADEYSIENLPDNKKEAFTYSAFACTGNGEDGEYAGREYVPTEIVFDEFWMYTYSKLCFDDVDLEGVYWIRLDIMLNNEEKTKLGSIVIYEKNEGYDKFKKMKFSKSELPK